MRCLQLLLSIGTLIHLARGQLPAPHRSQDKVVKYGEPASLWCASGNENQVCVWSAPNGVICDGLSALNPVCAADSDIEFTGNSKNCSILVTQLQDDQSGLWKCQIISQGKLLESTVDLQLAERAEVSFAQHFGTVMMLLGKPIDFKCQATKGRPFGRFFWRIGDEKDPKGMEILQNENEAHTTSKDQGYFTVEQTFKYTPDLKHQERRLYCVYTQTNNGETLYQTDDHISISILHLNSPSAPLIQIPTVKTGQNVTLSLEFGSKPKPISSDVSWVISTGDSSPPMKLTLHDFQLTTNGRFIAKPIDVIEEDKFRVTLIVQNVTEDDQLPEYGLTIQGRDTQGGVFATASHQFKVSVEASEKEEEKESEQQHSSSKSTTVVVIVIILLLLIVAAIMATVIITKQRKMWCFAPKPEPRNKDSEAQAPLNTQPDPIIRDELKR